MYHESSSYRIVAISLSALILLGPLGFVFLENMSYFDGLYMTVITVSTVGYAEIEPLGDAARWYVIALIVFGLSTASLAARQIGHLGVKLAVAGIDIR